jgi:prepilin-type N-terminal cleavage/methylation domain-containing protein
MEFPSGQGDGLGTGLAEYAGAVVHRSSCQRQPSGPGGSAPARRRVAGRAGFTLIELMVVIVIISVLAVLAIPSVTEELRSRRTQSAAREVASVYRTARMRALSRGSAVLVRYDASVDPEGRFEVREAIRSGSANADCNKLPISSCTSPTWTGAVDNMLLGGFSTANRGEYQSGGTKVVAKLEVNAATPPQYDVCFSPLGTTFARADQVSPFTAMTTVPKVRVQRNGIDGNPYGPIRVVLILPNGNAHLGMPEVP